MSSRCITAPLLGIGMEARLYSPGTKRSLVLKPKEQGGSGGMYSGIPAEASPSGVAGKLGVDSNVYVYCSSCHGAGSARASCVQ